MSRKLEPVNNHYDISVVWLRSEKEAQRSWRSTGLREDIEFGVINDAEYPIEYRLLQDMRERNLEFSIFTATANVYRTDLDWNQGCP